MMRALIVALVLLATRQAQATVTVAKSVVTPAPSIGGRISYALTMARFNVTAGQNGLHVLDTTPAGHTILSLSSGATAIDCTQAMSGVSLAGATASCGPASDVDIAFADGMPDNYSAVVTYRVTQQAYSNTVRTSCNTPATCPGTSSAMGTLLPAPATLTKTASSPTVKPGGTFDYTVTLRHTATTDVLGWVLTDTLPAGVTVTGVAAPVPSTVVNSGQVYTITPTVPLDPNKDYPFVFHCSVPDTATPGELRNMARAVPPGGTEIVSGEAVVRISPDAPPLDLNKTLNVANARIGQPVVYTITLTPTGSQPGPITLSDPIDPSLRITKVMVNGQPVACSVAPAAVGPIVLSCQGADGRRVVTEVAAGKTLDAPLRLEIDAVVLPSAGRTIINTATLTDRNMGMAQKSVTLTVDDASTSASVVVTAGKVMAQRGDLVPFAVAVGVPNAGLPLAASQLAISSSAGLRIGDVKITAPDGTVSTVRADEVNGVQQVSLPAIPAGATLTAQVRARINERARLGIERLAVQLLAAGERLAGAEAQVRVVADPDFDLGTVLGDVYRDENGNGMRDRGERGVEGALVVMDDGLQAVTDGEGRYHLSAVRPGDRAIKLAKHSLPPGSSFVTDETRVVNIGPGVLVKIDYGIKVPAPEAPVIARAPPLAVAPPVQLEGGKVRFRLTGQAAPRAAVRVGDRDATVDKTGAWYTDVVLAPGNNRLAQVVAWPDGRVVISERTVFLIERKQGGHLIVPRTDEARLVLRFPSSALAEPTFTLEGAALAPLAELTIAGEKVSPDAQGRVAIKLRLPEAGAPIQISAQFSDGLQTKFAHQLGAGADYLFLVGLAEAKGGYVIREGAAGESGLFAEGRVRLYTKGRIKGKYLIEGGLDIDSTQIDSWRDLFRGDPSRVFRNLDPDRFYTVYGDSSQTTQAAQSRSRLYVAFRVDRTEILFGNLQTGLTGVEMGRYSRAVTGGRVAFVRASPDDPNGPPSTQVIVFGAWLQTARAHDQLRGTGGSLYYLSHRSVVEGSEQVRIELRDRISDRPMTNVPQRATVDYEIDYFAGRIIMREPVSSYSASPTLIRQGVADGDRPYVIVDYEYIVTGEIDDGVVGARATQKIGPVRIGGTFVNEFRQVGGYQLIGADLQVDLKKYGTIIGEYAHSSGTLSSFGRSDDGGLTYHNALGTQAANPQGNAWKAEADLHLPYVDVHPYARGVDQGYVDTATATDASYIQWGVDATASFWKLKLKAHYDERRYSQGLMFDTNANPTLSLPQTRRDVGGEVAGQFGRFGVRLGVRHELADDPDPTRYGTRTAVGARLDVKVVPRLTLYGTGQYAFLHEGDGLAGRDNSLGALGLIADLGWDTKLNAEASYGVQGAGGLLSLRTELGPGRVLYGTVTLSQDRDDRLSTRVAAGGRERIADRRGNARAVLFAEDQFRDGPLEMIGGGRSHVIATGVELPLAKRFLFGATFERGTVTPSGTPLSGTPPIDRTAGTAYASYAGDKLRVQVKAELRADEQLLADGSTIAPLSWLTSGMVTWRPHKDLALRGKVFVSRASSPNLPATLANSTEATIGFAWRPSWTDRIALLGRYTYLDEGVPGAQGANGPRDPTTGAPLLTRESAHVMSLAWDGRIFWRFSLGEKLAAKFREEPDLGTSAWYILWVNRLALHITKRWDAVVEYRLLSVPDISISHGASVELNVILVGHLRVGAGWNFADFNDNELTLGRGRQNGFFLRAQGFY
jgi:uncharacterized repeat protein (TIGR01451 family)